MARSKKKKFKRTGKVVVRPHTRSPRGANAGKRIVKVKGYTRSKGRRKPKN